MFSIRNSIQSSTSKTYSNRLPRRPMIATALAVFALSSLFASTAWGFGCTGKIEGAAILPQSPNGAAGNFYIYWKDDANPAVTAGLLLCNMEDATLNVGGMTTEMCKTLYYSALAAAVSDAPVKMNFQNTVPEDPVNGDGNGTAKDCSEVKQWEIHEEFNWLEVQRHD